MPSENMDDVREKIARAREAQRERNEKRITGGNPQIIRSGTTPSHRLIGIISKLNSPPQPDPRLPEDHDELIRQPDGSYIAKKYL